MRIVIGCNYYHPYTSGVTEYVRRLAEGLAPRHDVTVVTAQHEPDLPLQESLHGVTIVRTPVWLKISKGTISPAFLSRLVGLARTADIVNLHLPMLEAGAIASLLDAKRLVVTYHCDIDLPPGLAKRLIEPPMFASMRRALSRARRIVVNTLDYAERSRTLRPFLASCEEIPPPIVDFPPVETRRKQGHPTIGFLGRFVEEKGLDVLLQAMQKIREHMPDAQLLLAGEFEHVVGGSIIERLRPLLDDLGSNVTLLGKLPGPELAAFFAGLDVFVLPSINSFESFGMVQVEAMLNGTPVVATDLPGVRTIVGRTGMGLIVPPRSPGELAQAIMTILADPRTYAKERSEIQRHYSLGATVTLYERVFQATGGFTATPPGLPQEPPVCGSC